MKLRRMLSMLIFLLGFGILMYPIISRAYYDYNHRLEVASWGQETGGNESQALYQQQVAYNQHQISNLDEIESVHLTFSENHAKIETDFNNPKVLGTLSIEAIDLNYPIYDGATDEHLYYGLARVEGTSYPVGGLNTNCVIAGHNGLVGKTYFSDIQKLRDGDYLEVRNRHELLTYQVYDHALVDPTAIEALAIIPGQDTLTLLTCSSTHPDADRYLVYAKRVPNRDHSTVNDWTTQNDNQARKSIDWQLFLKRYGKIIALIVFALFTVYTVFIRDTRRGDEDEDSSDERNEK